MVNTLPKWEARRHMHQFGHLEGSSRRATDDDMEPTGSIVFELVAVLQDGERVTVSRSLQPGACRCAQSTARRRGRARHAERADGRRYVQRAGESGESQRGRVRICEV